RSQAAARASCPGAKADSRPARAAAARAAAARPPRSCAAAPVAYPGAATIAELARRAAAAAPRRRADVACRARERGGGQAGPLRRAVPEPGRVVAGAPSTDRPAAGVAPRPSGFIRGLGRAGVLALCLQRPVLLRVLAQCL